METGKFQVLSCHVLFDGIYEIQKVIKEGVYGSSIFLQTSESFNVDDTFEATIQKTGSSLIPGISTYLMVERYDNK